MWGPPFFSFLLEHLMRITVKLFATFRRERFIAADREYPSGTRINDILTELKIPISAVGTIMLNSRHSQPEQELTDGDSLAIFPLVGGG